MTRTFEVTRRVPGHPNYSVSESGRVGRIGSTGHLRPCVLKRGGYLAVSLWAANRGRTVPVHIIVTSAFHGPRPSQRHDAAHADGNRRNNHWRNLAWKTRAENEADKVRHGTSNRGERNGQARLTAEQVAQIRARAAAGVDAEGLARTFGVTRSAIYNIVTSRSWRNQ